MMSQACASVVSVGIDMYKSTPKRKESEGESALDVWIGTENEQCKRGQPQEIGKSHIIHSHVHVYLNCMFWANQRGCHFGSLVVERAAHTP